MINTILGSKIKMGQTFVAGTRVPVTYIKAGPCVVTHIKKEEKDGYWAAQLGFGSRKIKNITKPQKGHLKGAISAFKRTAGIKPAGELNADMSSSSRGRPAKSGTGDHTSRGVEDVIGKSKLAPRFLREVKFDKEPELKVGDEIKVTDVLKKGDVLAITGTSKGKGFQGVMKRWGFAGGPRTHGQSDRPRSPGSIGQGTDPGRVWKGKKMAGRMGGDTVTVKNLVVVDIDEENDKILVSGPVPGNKGGLLKIKNIGSGGLKKLTQHVEQVVTAEMQEAEDPKDDQQGSVEGKGGSEVQKK